MGRLLYVVFDDSNPFGSRKPSASAPYPSFCDRLTIILHGSTSQKTILNIILAAVRT
jgi:hypothetical protein